MANPKIWVGAASPILGQRLESHTKTLMEGGLCPESTKPLARSIFDRLLPKGRKKDWREVWRVV